MLQTTYACASYSYVRNIERRQEGYLRDQAALRKSSIVMIYYTLTDHRLSYPNVVRLRVDFRLALFVRVEPIQLGILVFFVDLF